MEKYDIKCPNPQCERLQKFYLAIEGTSDQITIANSEGKITYANQTAEVITGYSKDEIIGNTPDLWAKNITTQGTKYTYLYKDMFATLRQGNSCFFGEVENINKEGKKYYTDVRITPIYDDCSNIKYYVITERDTTVARELDRLKLEFISISSHELRTPLASISLASELLIRDPEKNGKISQNQTFLIEEIYVNTQKMARLISSFMILARIEMGTVTVHPEPIDIHESLNKIISEFDIQITNKKLLLKKLFENQLPIINYDKRIFTIILDNIISNAIKYTPEGGRIDLKVNTDNQFIKVDVSDTGIGIKKSECGSIFNKQFRASNAVNSQEGDGLGLYIVKALIEKTGAKISVNSEVKKGTTFSLLFPIK